MVPHKEMTGFPGKKMASSVLFIPKKENLEGFSAFKSLQNTNEEIIR